jgi:hypothetical protein
MQRRQVAGAATRGLLRLSVSTTMTALAQVPRLWVVWRLQQPRRSIGRSRCARTPDIPVMSWMHKKLLATNAKHVLKSIFTRGHVDQIFPLLHKCDCEPGKATVLPAVLTSPLRIQTLLCPLFEHAVCCREGAISHNCFSENLDGAGFENSWAAENVLYNYQSGATAPAYSITQWMNSSGHRTNMMNGIYSRVGYGYYRCADGRVYWTGLYAS